MKLKPIMLTMACAFLSVGAASAADKPEAKPPANAVAADKPAPGFGFGSGTGAGPGGAPGSASSLADGFGSLTSNGGHPGVRWRLWLAAACEPPVQSRRQRDGAELAFLAWRRSTEAPATSSRAEGLVGDSFGAPPAPTQRGAKNE